jgi:protein farnesyltransferase subunit beta
MSSDDGFPTCTSEQQKEVEVEVLRIYGRVLNSPDFDPAISFRLNRESHKEFLCSGLRKPLKSSYMSLEASRPWIAFWILHALDLLGERELIESEFSQSVTQFLRACQCQTGGFGGGPYQIAHLATTYAAVSALVCIGTEDSLSIIDRTAMKRFLCSMKDPITGGFRMHQDGEIDVRGTYCAIAVASILQILDDSLTVGVGGYIKQCQTYEGGIAGEPGMEAHGGYSYCGLAALAIIGNAKEYIDIEPFIDWLCRRQLPYETGFSGRANKLVDSCYTFWQGASFPIIANLMREASDDSSGQAPILFAVEPAQMYVLLACQSESGGLRDKPGKHADFYHSCYALSGLAALQYPTNDLREHRVLGDNSGLERNCVLYNNTIKQVLKARQFYSDCEKMGFEGAGVLRSYSFPYHFAQSP